MQSFLKISKLNYDIFMTVLFISFHKCGSRHSLRLLRPREVVAIINNIVHDVPLATATCRRSGKRIVDIDTEWQHWPAERPVLSFVVTVHCRQLHQNHAARHSSHHRLCSRDIRHRQVLPCESSIGHTPPTYIHTHSWLHSDHGSHSLAYK